MAFAAGGDPPTAQYRKWPEDVSTCVGPLEEDFYLEPSCRYLNRHLAIQLDRGAS